jgi:hypothetical protein
MRWTPGFRYNGREVISKKTYATREEADAHNDSTLQEIESEEMELLVGNGSLRFFVEAS